MIWTVNDDPDVLRAVERDLRRHYGDRHDGEIEFESRPGETRFKVRLPIHREQSPSPQQQA